jgi:hypothetical protein
VTTALARDPAFFYHYRGLSDLYWSRLAVAVLSVASAGLLRPSLLFWIMSRKHQPETSHLGGLTLRFRGGMRDYLLKYVYARASGELGCSHVLG